MRCDECKHWDTALQSYRAVPDLGLCTKAVQLWDATEWSEPEDPTKPLSTTRRVVLPNLVDQMSFVQDGSDYYASLWTKPQFFCAHYEDHQRRDR